MKSIFKYLLILGSFACITTAVAETRVIQLAVQNCKVVIAPLTNNGCDANQCAGNSDCVCVGVNDEIEWKLPNISKHEFKFKFRGNNPLKQCGDKYTLQKKRCGMKKTLKRGDKFDYDIKIKKCDQVTDPRIVIK